MQTHRVGAYDSNDLIQFDPGEWHRSRKSQKVQKQLAGGNIIQFAKVDRTVGTGELCQLQILYQLAWELLECLGCKLLWQRTP